MSCALTIPQVRARTKTVTRRQLHTWRHLAVGEHLTLVERSRGLPSGAKQVVLGDVEIVDISIVELDDMTQAEVMSEGFPDWNVESFTRFWRATHGLPEEGGVLVRRIEWRYLD